MQVDPRAEWAQIYRETWRIQREYFYDAKMHGADWQAVYEKYRPLLAYVGHRADLGYLIAMVGGELTVGHSYLTGRGDVPGEEPVSVGLLGADFAVENGRYRISHIYTGENWNPDLRAPLSAPGIQVAEGDYLLEVNGRPLTPPTNLYSLFEGTAGTADDDPGQQDALAGRIAARDRGSGGQRRLATNAGVDRGEPPAGGQALRRTFGVCVVA